MDENEFNKRKRKSNKKINLYEFLNLMHDINPKIKIITYGLNFDEYIKKKNKVDIICECGNKYNMSFQNLLNGHKCKKCSQSHWALKDFNIFLNEVKVNNPDIEIVSEYINGTSPIDIRFKCGHVRTVNQAVNLTRNPYKCKECKTEHVIRSIIYDESDYSYCVYMHTNLINNKKYIGITRQNPEKRWKCGKGYKTGQFHNAILKYGWDNFEHEILYTNLNHKQACEMEVKLIEKYDTYNSNLGYNSTSGGDTGVRQPLTENQKKNISNTLRGQKLSEETKDKMSKAKTGSKNFKAKKVVQIDTNFNFIKMWDCMSEAERKLNISKGLIYGACNSNLHRSSGYLWYYESDYNILKKAKESK